MKNSTNLNVVNLEQILKSVQKIETDVILLVVDENVWNIYKDQLPLKTTLKDKEIIIFQAKSGEESKTFQEFEKCAEFFLERGVHRNAHLIALGGGATSDFAGFVTATLLRGISWSVIPTTLLSMIDASIGGKVALNSRYGKNLVGAFCKPQNVFLSVDFLKTLPEVEMANGKGELLKYAFLNKKIYDEILAGKDLIEIIRLSADFKLNITNLDLYESGKRKILNLGHTFGHAFESMYALPHGLAIVWGMIFVFKYLQDGKYIDEAKQLMDRLELDIGPNSWDDGEVLVNNLFSYIKRDKKRKSLKEIDLILLEDIGKPVVKSFDLKEIEEVIKRVAHEFKKFGI